jgi:hypothetical protein
MRSSGYLRMVQQMLILQFRDPFPDEKPSEISKKLRIVAQLIVEAEDVEQAALAG